MSNTYVSTIRLMRRQVRGNDFSWVEHVKPAVLDYNEGHVVIREPDTRILLADFPKWIIESVERIDVNCCKLNLKNNATTNSVTTKMSNGDLDQIALCFEKSDDADQYIKAATFFGITCANPEFVPAMDSNVVSSDISTFLRDIEQGINYPDVKDNHVQQFIIKLLFDPNFVQLVDDVEDMLDKLKERF